MAESTAQNCLKECQSSIALVLYNGIVPGAKSLRFQKEYVCKKQWDDWKKDNSLLLEMIGIIDLVQTQATPLALPIMTCCVAAN